MTARASGLGGRAEGLLLLVVGAGTLLFAGLGDYGRLLNPVYRPLTIVGAALVVAMGLAALLTRARRGSASGVGTFVAFLLLVGAGALVAPPRDAATSLFAPPEEGEATALPEGYGRRSLGDLYRTLQAESEAPSVETAFAVSGIAVRPPDVEARGEYVLLEAQMACCLADAIAVGFRVRGTPADLPEEGAWIYVYGHLEPLSAPDPVEPFRYGVLRWITVDADHAIASDGWVPMRSTFPSLRQRLEGEGMTAFVALLASSDRLATLDEEGPFTVFAPVAASLSRPGAGAEGDLHVIRGRYPRPDLYEIERLETIDGSVVTVENRNGTLVIGGARVLFTEEDLRNGVLHHVHRPLQARPE